eukprot:969594-Prymnesium_polylepis.2
MAKTPDGTPVTDSAGNEIKVDGLRPRRRRRDGCGGFNVLIDWRQRLDADGSPKPASRGTVHLTRSGVITQKTPQLYFKKFNYRVVWVDKSKGPRRRASSPSRVIQQRLRFSVGTLLYTLR